jgi:uncharacterized protein (DUF1015 family)
MTTGDHAPSGSAIPSPGGLVLAPFRALRYAGPAADTLARLLCPPYDVIDAEQQTALENSDPRNAVHVILPRDDQAGPGSRYQRAARTLREWRSDGVLQRDSEPAIYVYEMSSETSTTRGLVGALALVDPNAGIVLPHENTMPGPVADRLALTEATEANLETIYLVYDGSPTTGEIVAGVDAGPALLDTRTEDGRRHRLWPITDAEQLRTLATELYPQRALIADGHHRYATYLASQRKQHEAGRGAGPWDFGLTYLVDARRFGPHVEAIHRVIPSLSVSDAVLQAGAAGFVVSGLANSLPEALAVLSSAGKAGTAFVLTDGERWFLLVHVGQGAAADGDGAAQQARSGRSALDRLDVTVAHRVLIERAWQVAEDVVEYEHDAARAVQRAEQTHGLALLLNPTSVDDVAAVAAAGDRMPRKSTLFTPKPATGIVFRPYDEG